MLAAADHSNLKQLQQRTGASLCSGSREFPSGDMAVISATSTGCKKHVSLCFSGDGATKSDAIENKDLGCKCLVDEFSFLDDDSDEGKKLECFFCLLCE